ncbi:MAG: hypothetical protein CMJ35_04920 [Phycisphaerae bacterium]|nr:hypothetical protein [Phycisphaerae bacterium]
MGGLWFGWGREELGRGFAGGLGVGWRFGFVLAEVGEARDGEGFGFGLHELAPGAGDGFDHLFGGFELLGVDDVDELVEGKVVIVAQIEGADGGVEEVFEEVVGEGWCLARVGLLAVLGGFTDIGMKTPSADCVGSSLAIPGRASGGVD